MLLDDWLHFSNEVSKLIARTWLDDQFREQFITHPKDCLQQVGLTLPNFVEVQVELLSERWRIEPSPDFRRITLTICLPSKPTDTTDENLRDMQEGLQRLPEFERPLALICCAN